MALTEFGTNHPLAVKLYSKALFREALQSTWIKKFIGTGSNSLIQLNPELKQVGDKLTYGLRMLLTGDGQTGDSTLEGNEEDLVFYSDSISINQMRHAVRSAGKMSEQRIPYSVREEAKMALADWMADKLDYSFFNQISGNTGETKTQKSGMNTITAPDTSHWIYATGDGESTLSASSVFSLTTIDKLKVKATTMSSVPIRPMRINGEDKFVVFIHPFQHYSLRANTNTGQYIDIQKAAIQGGQTTKNTMFTGALGEYNGCILHEAYRVPSYVANTRRAILCGAQAAVLCTGRQTGAGLDATWAEELKKKGSSLKNCVNSVKLHFGQYRAKLGRVVKLCYDYATHITGGYYAGMQKVWSGKAFNSIPTLCEGQGMA